MIPKSVLAYREKSEKAKKREEKKAEKKAKKANLKAGKGGEEAQVNGDGGDAGAENAPDVAAGKYGEQRMNQSREKPRDKNFIDVSILGPKLNGQKVWVRARLHTSRATGM